MLCNTCNIEKDLEQFHQYKKNNLPRPGGASPPNLKCKSCTNNTTNKYDKKRKKSKRASQRLNTFKVCKICKISKYLNNFVNLKKFYKKNICLDCYPLFLMNQKMKLCKKINL